MTKSKSIFRREPRDKKHDAIHSIKFAIGFLAILLLVMNSTNWMYRFVWLDLEKVYVPDHAMGADPILTINRDIITNHDAKYSVTIRLAETSAHVCTVSPEVIIPYKRAASVATPELTMPLSRWLDDAAALRKCQAKGFEAGTFYLRTCHFRMIYGFPIARRCVESNTFKRFLQRNAALQDNNAV